MELKRQTGCSEDKELFSHSPLNEEEEILVIDNPPPVLQSTEMFQDEVRRLRRGVHPVWNKNGKELFYLASDKKLISVDVKSTGTSFEHGIPKSLFTTDVDSYASFNRFAVSKDENKFMINTSVDGTNAKPIMVILNWTAEGKK
jgi:hypothetical protein